MIGRLLPAARILVHGNAGAARRKTLGRPDVVEPAAPVGGSPFRPTPTPTPRPTPTPGPFGAPGGVTGAEGASRGPVMGVYSKSTQRGYRLWEGREAYNEWKFTEQSLYGTGQQGGGGNTGPTPGPGIGGLNPLPPGGGGTK